MKKHKRLASLIAANRQAMLYIFIINILLLIPATLAPVFKQVFADDILAAGASDWMLPLLIMMTGTALLSAACTWLQKSCMQRLSNHIEVPRAAGYIWRLFHMPLRQLQGSDSAALLSQVTATRSASRVLTRDIIEISFSLVSVILYLVMMLNLDALLAVAVVGMLLASFGMGKFWAYLGKRYARKEEGPGAGVLAAQEARVSAQGLSHIETYKSTASEGYLFERVLSAKHALARARRAIDYKEAYRPMKTLPQILFLNALLLISALRIMNRTFSIGSYLAFQAYAVAFFNPFNAVLGAKAIFDRVERELERLHEAMGAASFNMPVPDTEAEAGRLSGAIRCQGVTYIYEGMEEPALSDVSLTVHPGQRIAILGKSGAGKSTLLKLLQGMYTPTAGEVTMDGVAPDRLPPATRRLSIGSANQQITLFTASIRNNITLWDHSVSQAEIYHAARGAQLHDDIVLLERGYDYEVGENGSNFSGGQRQKIELARALLYDPGIVILDEATGSIDPAARGEIERHLLQRGCTVIAVTHLIRHIENYDEIIVLDKGRITHRGTHEELLAQSPYYAAVYREEMEVAAV